MTAFSEHQPVLTGSLPLTIDITPARIHVLARPRDFGYSQGFCFRATRRCPEAAGRIEKFLFEREAVLIADKFLVLFGEDEIQSGA